MNVKLLTEHHLECLSLKGGCRGSSESTHVKMPHCWKSHALAHFVFVNEDAINIASILRLVYDASRQMLMLIESRLGASNKQIIRVTRNAIYIVYFKKLHCSKYMLAVGLGITCNSLLFYTKWSSNWKKCLR